LVESGAGARVVVLRGGDLGGAKRGKGQEERGEALRDRFHLVPLKSAAILDGPSRRREAASWRVARAFDLADITNTVGCPVLRVRGEGRESEMPAPTGFAHASETKSNSTRSTATHTCN